MFFVRKGTFILLAALTATSPAAADPPEINQEIVELGLSPCDPAPGFPCIIQAPGSYRLTSDLVSTDPGVHIIEITAPGVTLDLSGHSVRGPANCTWTGSAVNCASGTGSGDGVHASAAETTVRNGRLIGVADDGMSLGNGAIVESVQIDGAGGAGIVVGAGARVQSSTVQLSRDGGIVGSLGSSVLDCTVHHVGSVGITGASLIEGNRVISNHGNGIETAMSGLARCNVVRDNGGDGIVAAIDTLVLANTTAENQAHGLRFLFVGAYGGNTIGDNLSGSVIGPGVEVAVNLCDGVTACP